MCKVDGCTRQIIARGWCPLHYSRWRRRGDPGGPELEYVRHSSPGEAFSDQTERSGDCLIWTGLTNGVGYGVLKVEGKAKLAHRYSWEREIGPLGPGVKLDHCVCRNPLCVETARLRPATNAENGQNRSGAARHSKTGVRNVSPRGDKYVVAMSKDNKQFHFGTYDTIAEAAEVAEAKRIELFGEFAGRG